MATLFYKKIKNLIPLKTREKIRKQLGDIILPCFSLMKIDGETGKLWESWAGIRLQESCDLLIYGDEVLSNSKQFQRFLQQLETKGHRIFIISISSSSRRQNLFNVPIKVVRTGSKKVYSVKISSLKELFDRNKHLTRLGIETILVATGTLLKEARIINPVAVIVNPSWNKISARLAMPVLYGFPEDQKDFNNYHQALLGEVFPKISIIVLVYNKPKYTKWCLDSIINRSFYPNIELVIVDNGSDKTTKNLLVKYTKNKMVKLITSKTNKGFAAGNNLGLAKATGDYLVILNNDTVVTPGWLSRLVYHVVKNRAGLVGPVTNNVLNESRINIGYKNGNWTDMENKAGEYGYSHWGEARGMGRLIAFCWILSRDTYQKIGVFDTRYGQALFEDDDYCMRVKKLGLKLLCAEDVFVHHFGSMTFNDLGHEKINELLLANKTKFEKKWKTRWSPHKSRNEPAGKPFFKNLLNKIGERLEF